MVSQEQSRQYLRAFPGQAERAGSQAPWGNRGPNRCPGAVWVAAVALGTPGGTGLGECDNEAVSRPALSPSVFLPVCLSPAPPPALASPLSRVPG